MAPSARLTGRSRALAALVTVLAACTPSGPSPSPSDASPSPGVPASVAPTAPATPESTDPLVIYAAIAAQVAAIRGLEPTAAVTPVVIDEATLLANLEAEYEVSNPPEEAAATDRLLRALGLLDEGVSLRDAQLELNASQIIGYYDSSTDELYVVDRGGALGATARATYAHEFTHQLQDQHFDLEGLGLGTTVESDRALALLGLIEGDATLTQTLWLVGNFDQADFAELLRDAADPAVTAALERAPAILVATSLFPYQEGGLFVGALSSGVFGPVDAAYLDPPGTTEQILHLDKYLAREPADTPFEEPPETWLTTLGAGWSVGTTDTLGEFLLRFWLTEHGVAADVAADAAAGWGGDRAVLFDGPGGAAVVALATRWDALADAAAYRVAAADVAADLGGRIIEGPAGIIVLVGDPAAVDRLAAEAAGR
jgi:hypothetical protein